jgi:RHS repeat-associated protein
MHASALALLSLLVIGSPAWALPEDDLGALHKTQEAPGFNPERLYTEILPTDHVDVFSGALMLTQPLWSAPQAGDLSLAVSLYHSSTLGDARMWGGTAPEAEEEGQPPHHINRFRTSWVGPMFELSLGRIAVAPIYEDKYEWHWLDETGALHRLFPATGAPVPTLPDWPGFGNGLPAPLLPPGDPCPGCGEDPPPPPPPPANQTYVTRDGTFIRADYFRSQGFWVVYFPDDTAAALTHYVPTVQVVPTWPSGADAMRGGGFWLTQKRDRHGNGITVAYHAAAHALPGAIASIADSTGRHVDFDIYPAVAEDPRSGHLEKLRTTGFGGIPAETTFDYESATIQELTEHYQYGGQVVTSTVPRLVEVKRPEGFTTTFTWDDVTQPPLVPACGYTELDPCPWLTPVSRWQRIAQVTYPTGGEVHYMHGGWLLDMMTRRLGQWEATTVAFGGVVRVDRFADGDEANFDPGNVSTWRYIRGCDRVHPCVTADGDDFFCQPSDVPPGVPCPSGGEVRDSCWGRVTTIAPDGTVTRHRFQMEQLRGYNPNKLSHALEGKELTRTVYSGPCTTGGGEDFDHSCDLSADPCLPHELQRTITEWEADWIGSREGSGNLRQAGTTTWTKEADGTWVRATTSKCEWDGYGHHQRETKTATGSLLHEPLTSFVRYTPNPLGWVLGAWTDASDEQSRVRVNLHARFDAQGRLTDRQGVADLEEIPGNDPTPQCALSSSAVYPVDDTFADGLLRQGGAYPDPLLWPSLASAYASSHGAPLDTGEGDLVVHVDFHSAGDGLGKPWRITRSVPEPRPGTPGTAPAARTDELTWRAGKVASRKRLVLSPEWFAFRQDVDVHTGLPLRQYDPSNVATEYQFDLLGRLALVAPAELAPTRHVWHSPTRLQVTVESSDGGSDDYYELDGFGRLRVHERTGYNAPLVFRKLKYDGLDRKVRESRWQQGGTAWPWIGHDDPPADYWTETVYTLIHPTWGTISDPLGRVRKEIRGPGSATEYEFPLAAGTRTVQRGLNGDANAVVSTLRRSNGLGQLVEVTPDQPGGASATYSFDVLGKLSRAVLVGQASGTTFTQERTWTRDGLGNLVAARDPESGLTEYLAHDVEGNVVRTRDENGRAAGYTLLREYDAAGRLIILSRHASASSDLLAYYSYDGVGSPIPGTHDLGKLTFETTELLSFGGYYARSVRHSGRGGRPDKTLIDVETDDANRWLFEDHMTYTDRGLVESYEYPTLPIPGSGGWTTNRFAPGDSTHYTYSAGYVSHATFTSATGVVQHVTVSDRAPSGVPVHVVLGNGVSRFVELDAQERIRRIHGQRAAATLWDSGLYEFDGIDNIVDIGTDPAGPGSAPQSFRYDAQLRLVEATLPTSTVTYGFDDFGNMTDRIGSPFPAPGEGGFAGRVHHDGTAHDNRIHDPGFAFDGNGNLVLAPDGNRVHFWDEQDRLIAVFEDFLTTRIGHHAYDGAGERLVQETPTETRFYYRGGGPAVLMEYVLENGDWRADRLYLPDGEGKETGYVDLLGSQRSFTYYLADHLGTPRLLTNGAGDVLSEHLYEPFGLEVPPTATSSNTHRFTGHERDAATGLDYMHARYCDGRLGRFLTADPGRDTEPEEVQSWNVYSYVRNEPVAALDPTGLAVWNTVVRVGRYVASEGKYRLVERISGGSKNRTMARVTRALDTMNPQQGARRVVVAESEQARDGIAGQLSGSGKIHGPEQSPGFPEHVHPKDGPYKDVHVQTVEDTKKAGFGKGLLSIIAPTAMAAAASSDATAAETASAALWDVAKAIDPIFLTDAIEMATGADEYVQRAEPEPSPQTP